MTDRYEKLREEYEGRGLDSVTHLDPWPLFEEWQNDADVLPLANAMALATADPDGTPSVRMVLLKNIDDQNRLWFFTDYQSRKGRELVANNRAELLFYWQPLHRQVRINGSVERLPDADSDAYFAARPRASSLSAMASSQSAIVPGGARAIEKERERLEVELEGQPLTRPESWGGLALTATSFEFWQGRPDRLHHRLFYERGGDGAWTRRWLAP